MLSRAHQSIVRSSVRSISKSNWEERFGGTWPSPSTRYRLWLWLADYSLRLNVKDVNSPSNSWPWLGNRTQAAGLSLKLLDFIFSHVSQAFNLNACVNSTKYICPYLTSDCCTSGRVLRTVVTCQESATKAKFKQSTTWNWALCSIMFVSPFFCSAFN